MTVPFKENTLRETQYGAVARFLAMATAIPEGTVAQDDSAVLAQQLNITKRWHKLLPTLYRKSGVLRRSSVLLDPSEGDLFNRQSFYQVASTERPFGPTTAERMQAYSLHAGPLLERAAKEALSQARMHASSITHLITVSCTGFSAPGIDHHLIDRLGLPMHTQRTHVGFMGCHGMINGLRVAEAVVRSQPDAIAMVGAVELCSIHQQYCDDSEQIVANSLFSDGAACVILANDSADSAFTDSTSGSGVTAPWEIVSSFSCKLEETGDMMSWKIGDHGFQMTLSPRVPKIIEERLRGPLTRWLSENHVDVDSVQTWAVHPGGPRILDSVAACLGLSEKQIEPSRNVLAHYGNMSSPTVLFILEKIVSETDPGEYSVVIGFGPGLHTEALLLRRIA